MSDYANTLDISQLLATAFAAFYLIVGVGFVAALVRLARVISAILQILNQLLPETPPRPLVFTAKGGPADRRDANLKRAKLPPEARA